ncbi:cytochrome c [Stappia sp. F7233]|uniref:Cytochrome c n=1 Tax=Stappia albiluteola TaxID=2758565 RepID=A0A839AF62_9HYPH|nr:cytochrome c [Stappia albiluteola]MBA5777584.1 cytochrome c [Stappia albiluteola]
MRRRTFSRILGFILLVIAAGLWLTRPERIDAAALPEHSPDLANGEVMFWAGGCASCHAAPGAKGEAKLLLEGGLDLKSPFGTFRIPNITPSKTAGIGNWSTADFVTAMVKGTSPDGRHYYPAFPYGSYRTMRFEDLIDLKAFLDTLPSSENAVGDHQLAFPYSIRAGVGVWKMLYLDVELPQTASGDPIVERGAYLAKGPGHCAECHTPRDFIGGLNLMRWMAGAPDPEGGDGRVPNITPDGDGIGSWAANDIAYFLETGFTPDFDSVGGSMTSVQDNWSRVPAADREAIAAYLKAIPPLPSSPAPAAQ